MRESLNSKLNDEIDLREALTAVWAYKFFITFFCLLGLAFGIYKALNSNTEFSSTAIFKLDGVNLSKSSLNLELASIVGFGNSLGQSTILKDQYMGRIFI